MCRERSRKQFAILWRSLEARIGLFMRRKNRESSFHHGGGPMKLVLACLCAGKDREISFHLCGGHVKLVQGCLIAGKVQQIRFKPP